MFKYFIKWTNCLNLIKNKSLYTCVYQYINNAICFKIIPKIIETCSNNKMEQYDNVKSKICNSQSATKIMFLRNSEWSFMIPSRPSFRVSIFKVWIKCGIEFARIILIWLEFFLFNMYMWTNLLSLVCLFCLSNKFYLENEYINDICFFHFKKKLVPQNFWGPEQSHLPPLNSFHFVKKKKKSKKSHILILR